MLGKLCLHTFTNKQVQWHMFIRACVHDYVCTPIYIYTYIRTYIHTYILMDLTKAFDCLPHSMLLGKLSAYGLSDKSCSLVSNYLSNRKQRVKLGPHYNEWTDIVRGVPQGSIIGPLLFNVFINDIFHILVKSSLYNYADDTTLSYAHSNSDTLIHTLQQECTSTLQWFNINQMKANPSKFQAVSFGKWGTRDITHFTFENTTIHCENYVVLLGIEVDHSLTFNTHIANICKKAARQLAVLKRLGHLLTRQGKLAIFKSFITSNFNYCPLIWHLCSQSSTKKLQERAFRFIYNDSSSTHHDLLKTANTEHLHVKRIKEMACEVFKIVNNIAPIVIPNLIILRCSQYSMRKDNTAVVPKANTSKYGLKSFVLNGPRIWNSLPNETRKKVNYGEFCRLIRNWDGLSCNCSICR